MEQSELDVKHSEYSANIDAWRMYEAAYAGTQSLLDLGIIKRLKGFLDSDGNAVDEPTDLYKERLATAFGFALSERLIDVVMGYVFAKPTDYDFDKLKDDKIFSMFVANADKNGEKFEIVGQNYLLNSKIYGHTGALMTKGVTEGARTVATDVADGLYPYVTEFTPPSIYNWEYELVNGVKELIMLNLFDSAGRHNIWYKDTWEIWTKNEGGDFVIMPGDSGVNDLGYIPFSILKNGKSRGEMGGTSEIKEISRYDIALINNAHSAARIIKFGAFPMLVVPEPSATTKMKKFIIDAAAVFFSNPNKQNSKPEWLKTEVQQPLEAISKWNENIILEAYKSIHASFMNDNGGGVESGEAKKRAFQSFNASLAKSAKALETLEYSLINQWLDWQNQSALFESVSIVRPDNFDVSSLIEEIDEIVAARGIVQSETFDKVSQKLVVRKSMPDISDEDMIEITKEIDASQPDIVDEIDGVTDENLNA